jgi:plasmid stability protein
MCLTKRLIMTKDLRDKKTEMLEVRLSHQDKKALQLKAHNEGRSASAVVRSLIRGYVKPLNTEEQSTLASILTRPRIIIATLAAMLGGTVLIPTVSANEVALKLSGSIVEAAESGSHTLSFEREVELELRKPVSFDLTGGDRLIKAILDVDETEDGLFIRIILYEFVDGEKIILARPILVTNSNASASIMFGGEQGSMISFSLTPRGPTSG